MSLVWSPDIRNFQCTILSYFEAFLMKLFKYILSTSNTTKKILTQKLKGFSLSKQRSYLPFENTLCLGCRFLRFFLTGWTKKWPNLVSPVIPKCLCLIFIGSLTVPIGLTAGLQVFVTRPVKSDSLDLKLSIKPQIRPLSNHTTYSCDL